MPMIIPCTVNCLTCFVSAQVNQLQHAVPVQQRYKTTTDHGKYHTPLDTAIRTLRIETSKKGRPNTPRHPSSAESSQKDLDAPIPKELGLPSLEGGMLGRQNREKESKMAVAKRQGREKPAKGEQKKIPRTPVRTSGKTNNTPGWPNLHRTGPERDKHINRGAKASLLSCALSLFRVFRSTCPHASKMDFPAIF